MIYQGEMHVYFNRHGAAPLVWCVSPADHAWELAVAIVEIRVPSATRYMPKPTPDDEDGKPSAVIAVIGQLWLTAGAARIVTP